jgi:membrane-associated phospholipid phosphatase
MLARRVSLSAAAAALLGLVWLAMFLMHGSNADLSLLMAIRTADGSSLEQAARILTKLGDWEEALRVPLWAGALLLIWQRRLLTAALLVAITYSGEWIVHAEKTAIGFARPDPHLWLVHVDSPTFPSGHAADSMVVYLSIALLLPRAGNHRRALVAAALLLSLLIGISRLMLGVHWPTDVVAGWAFGGAWALVWCSIALALESEPKPASA